MKRAIVIITSLLALQAYGQPHDWENPAVLGIHKLPYHATLQLPSREKECKEIISLDGQWLFHWSPTPESRPADFYREDYDVSQWGRITVPGNWQTQGYGTPIYTNIEYPFVRNRPSVTTEPPKDWTAYENRIEGNQVVVEMSLAIGAELTLTYQVKADGRIKVDMAYKPTATDLPLMPKFGMRMRLPTDFTQIRYYGRGPWENYPDRKGSALIGIYETTLKDYETEYIHPQDNGNRSDIRWFEIGKLHIEGLQPLCIRAWDYGEEDLVGVRHPQEIKRGRFVNLNIDLSVHGLGGADTWGKHTLPQYTIPANQPHHYSFVLSSR